MKNKLLIILITIICYCNVYSQSLWQTSAIPFTGDDQFINDVSFVTADIGYVNVCNHSSNVFNQITIYKTTDKGFNWISKGNIGINAYSDTKPSVEFINVNTGYVGTIKEENNIYYMVIYKTTNGCSNWSSVSVGIAKYNYPLPECKFEFINETTGYVSTLYDIYQTTNAGQNWIQRTVNSYSDSYFINAIEKSDLNNNTFFAAGGKYANNQFVKPYIMRTTNNGISFETIIDGFFPVKGILDMSVVGKNGKDVLKLVYKYGGVAEYSDNNLFVVNDLQMVSKCSFLKFLNNEEGIIAVTVSVGSTGSEDRIIKTKDGGYNWDLENYEYGAADKFILGFEKVGDVIQAISQKKRTVIRE